MRAASGAKFEVKLREGRPVSITCSEQSSPRLGELIVADSKVLPTDEPSSKQGLIGGWFVARGVCTDDELCGAIRLQMSIRLSAMLRERTAQGTFRPEPIEQCAGLEPESFASLCMRTARRMHLGAEGWNDVPLKVSFVGRQLLESFALGPAERACLELCTRRPVSSAQLQDILGDAPMVFEAISSLFWLGAFERARRGHGSYLSLLRERRWARAERPPGLLSPEERRRRIGAAHPDRFADDPSKAVKHASEEAVRALLRES